MPQGHNSFGSREGSLFENERQLHGNTVSAAEIAAALGDARREGHSWRCRCPVHGGRSLCVRDGEGNRVLVTCWGGCDRLTVLAELGRRKLLKARAPDYRLHPESKPVRDDTSRVATALAIWDEARDSGGTIVESYLASRHGSLSLPTYVAGEAIRFHPTLQINGTRVGGMVALMRDVLSNEPCGIHRTFLDKAGRALLDGDGRKIRKMLGRAGGAAVKLVADEEVMLGLGIVEGVEDGLSVMLSGWRPIWVTTSAGAIQRFPVLAAIEALTIFADADTIGMAAAEQCAMRWIEAGREARICSPQNRLRYD